MSAPATSGSDGEGPGNQGDESDGEGLKASSASDDEGSENEDLMVCVFVSFLTAILTPGFQVVNDGSPASKVIKSSNRAVKTAAFEVR